MSSRHTSPPSLATDNSIKLAYYRWYQARLTRLTKLWQRVQLLTNWTRLKGQLAKTTAVSLLAAGTVLTPLGLAGSAPVVRAAPAAPVSVTTTADEFNIGGDCSLREAIQLANGDLTERGCGTTAATSISVPSGTITLSLTGIENDGYPSGTPNNQINDLDILSGTTVTITGQGSGNTIIQAGTTPDDGTGAVGNGIDRLFHVLGDLTLNDVTLRNGLVSGGGNGKGLGGGIAVRNGTLAVNNSVITGNTAVDTGTSAYDGYGGGINNAGGTVTLNNTQVNNNNATDNGGGIATWGYTSTPAPRLYITGGTINNNNADEGGGIGEVSYGAGVNSIVTIDGTTISGNVAAVQGGALDTSPGATAADIDITIQNATIENNQSDALGGGLNLTGSNVDVTITGSTIRQNETVGNRGGGISFGGNTLDIDTSTISGNQANLDGGGILVQAGSVNINTSTISGNQSAQEGGGLDGQGGTITINESLLTGNSARYGGALRATNASTTLTMNNSTVSGNSNTNTGFGTAGLYISNNATATVVNATITGNTTAGAGNGNALYLYTGGTAVLKNSIVTNNDGDECVGAPTGNDNLVDDGTCVGSLGTVTGFNGTLADNGGPTLTHAIDLSSNAIDTGNAGDCTAVDQRGVSRPQDGDIDNTAVCDIGAVEAIPQVCSVVTSNPYTFGGGVVINFDDLASTNLDCLSVEFVAGNHPNATSSGSSDALETGQYWRINGFQSDGTTPATGTFQADITLPYAGADADTRACKWLDGVGSGFGWDCGTDADNQENAGVSVTRVDYTGGFSDWAVGDQVGPTAVQMQETAATDPDPDNNSMTATLLAVLTGLLGATWLALRHRFSRGPQA